MGPSHCPLPLVQGARRLQEQLAEREIESAVLAHDTALRATDQAQPKKPRHGSAVKKGAP